MRQTYKIALSFMALATMALTGCQQQREMAPEEVAQAGSVAAEFSTQSITRVINDTQWEGTEMIGISNTTKQATATTNIAYKATQSGASTKFTDQGTKLMLPGDNSTVAFAAYYPYASNAQGNMASYTINNGTNQPVLFATQSGTAQNPQLPFTFRHKLAQVKLVLTLDADLQMQDLTAATFKGGVTDMKMNILTGDITLGSNQAEVTLKNAGNGTFISYVVPQTFSDYSFVITLGGKTYTLPKSKVAQAPDQFKEGNSYTFKAKLTKEGKFVNPDGSTIDNMNNGGEHDGGTLTPGEPGTGGDNNPGTGGETPTPTPTTGNLLFPGGDFEDFAAFQNSLNSYKLKSYATQGTDAEQGSVLHINGTPSGNDYVFTVENVAVNIQNPTKITFKVKGTAAGKSLSLNVYTGGKSYAPFNVGTITGSKTVTKAGNNQYTGSIDTNGQWVTITLDISGIAINKTGSGDFFALKVGKDSAWDVMVDDFKIE